MVKTPASGRSWQRRDPAAPSQPDGEPPLSRARIAAAAIAILDADGLDGLSMRKLADRLGAGVMSLYWHVANKDALLDLALDAVLALPRTQTPGAKAAGTQTAGMQAPDKWVHEKQTPDKQRGETEQADTDAAAPPAAPRPTQAAEDWRADILDMAEDWRAAMLAHPWSASLLPSRARGPNILARLELLGATLARAGVPEADINAAIWSVWNHVMGATVTRASFAVSSQDRQAAQTRLNEPAAPHAAATDPTPSQSAPAQSAGHPTISRTRLLMDDDWDGAFRKGLGFLLDGLAPQRR